MVHYRGLGHNGGIDDYIPAIPNIFQNGPPKNTACEVMSEEDNKEVLGLLNETSSFFIEITGLEREMQKTHISAPCVTVCCETSVLTPSAFPFSSGNVASHLLLVGKSLLNL